MHSRARGRWGWRWGILATGLLLAGLLLLGAWSSRRAAGDAPPRTIVAYGAIALEDVFTRGIFPAFAEDRKLRSGEDVRFNASFNPLGIVTDALLDGAPADLAFLSAASAAQDLELAGIVSSKSSLSLPHGGIVSRTPIIIAVRRGNPHRIASFEDLARPGIKVIQPDPLVSGTGQWVIFAEYGSALRETGDAHAAAELLVGIARNVVARAASPLEAGSLFERGIADVLVTSEHEALHGASLVARDHEIIYPPRTILSEPTLVLIERNIAPGERDLIEAFVRFIWSESGQDIFVRFGFRSVDARLEPFSRGQIREPFQIGDLGGWKSARRQIIEGVWRNRVLKEVRR